MTGGQRRRRKRSDSREEGRRGDDRANHVEEGRKEKVKGGNTGNRE